MREKLIELLGGFPMFPSYMKYLWMPAAVEKLADYLIASGVVREKGEWKYIGGDEWCCSNCGYVASTEGRWEPMTDDFCRGCGADLRKEDAEA